MFALSVLAPHLGLSIAQLAALAGTGSMGGAFIALFAAAGVAGTVLNLTPPDPRAARIQA